MPFALHKYGQNCFDDNISALFSRFLVNLLGNAQLSLKKFKDIVLCLNVLLRDRISFSGISTPGHSAFPDFPAAHLHVS